MATLVGAAALINAWGRTMQFKRAGVLLFTFKGRRAETRPTELELMESVDQHLFKIMGLATAFGNITPRKFDIIIDEYGDEYTVQRGRRAGADVDELVHMIVKGGIV